MFPGSKWRQTYLNWNKKKLLYEQKASGASSEERSNDYRSSRRDNSSQLDDDYRFYRNSRFDDNYRSYQNNRDYDDYRFYNDYRPTITQTETLSKPEPEKKSDHQFKSRMFERFSMDNTEKRSSIKEDKLHQEPPINTSKTTEDGIAILRRRGYHERKIDKILKEFPFIWDYINAH